MILYTEKIGGKMANKTTKSEEKKVIKKAEKKMYLGPNLKKYGLITGQIYEGEHSNVKNAISEIKRLDNLFVKIDKNFPKVKERFAQKGTKENILYSQVLKQIGGK